VTPDAAHALALAWGRCRACRLPGLAPVELWERPVEGMPMCGFCGARLERTDEDLSGEAAAVVAAPQRRNAT
jgi:hypothetical protein